MDQFLDFLDRARLATLTEEEEASLPIDVFRVVLALRVCRPGMVQTEKQYRYIYSFLQHCFSQQLLGL